MGGVKRARTYAKHFARPLVICDKYRKRANEIAEMTVMAADHIRRFGIDPKAALLSHSNFGSRETATAKKIRA